MFKNNSQKGSIEISSFTVAIIVAMTVATASVFLAIKYFEMLDVISLDIEAIPKVTSGVALTPVPDETADWKTYANTEYGFELKYPENFYAKENYWSSWNGTDSVIALSNNENFDKTEFSFLLSVGVESDINDKLTRYVSDETAQLTAKKLKLGSLKNLINTKVVGVFAGDPPWGYYSVYIRIPNGLNTGLLVSARIHQADDPGYGGDETDLNAFREILSTFKLINISKEEADTEARQILAEKVIKDRANKALLAIRNKNLIELSAFVHPEKGVRFSPYSNVSEENILFTKEQMKKADQDNTEYLWGHSDGSGLPIKETFKDYYSQFIYDKDFAAVREISYNQRLGSGNTVDLVDEFYKNNITVEYHFSGFNPKFGGLDWESLRLVFQEKDNVWYLVGIVHDQWTI